MDFIAPPQGVINHRPKATPVDVGPPTDISADHCEAAKALHQYMVGGPFDGLPFYSVFMQPTPQEAIALSEGGAIEVRFYGLMPMHSARVVDAEGGEV